MARVIERVEAHYDVREVEFGTVYRWCPEGAVVDCECGEELFLTASWKSCGECGANHEAIVREVLDVRSEDEVEPPGALRAFITRLPGAPSEDRELPTTGCSDCWGKGQRMTGAQLLRKIPNKARKKVPLGKKVRESKLLLRRTLVIDCDCECGEKMILIGNEDHWRGGNTLLECGG